MRIPRRSKRGSNGHELAAARAEARASAGQAQADLAEQKAKRAEEEALIVTPLRQMREANHFAAIIEAAFRGES